MTSARDWVEPDEVDALLADGVPVLVEWCLPPRPTVADEGPQRHVLPSLVDGATAARRTDVACLESG